MPSSVDPSRPEVVEPQIVDLVRGWEAMTVMTWTTWQFATSPKKGNIESEYRALYVLNQCDGSISDDFQDSCTSHQITGWPSQYTQINVCTFASDAIGPQCKFRTWRTRFTQF